jgi:hypothetical protein
VEESRHLDEIDFRILQNRDDDHHRCRCRQSCRIGMVPVSTDKNTISTHHRHGIPRPKAHPRIITFKYHQFNHLHQTILQSRYPSCSTNTVHTPLHSRSHQSTSLRKNLRRSIKVPHPHPQPSLPSPHRIGLDAL